MQWTSRQCMLGMEIVIQGQLVPSLNDHFAANISRLNRFFHVYFLELD